MMRPARESPRSSIGVLDSSLAACTVASAAYLAYLAAPFAGTPLFAVGHVAMIAATLAGVLVTGALLAARRGWRIRAAARIVAVLMAVLAAQRWQGWRHADRDWPPRGATSMEEALATLDTEQRVRWGAHVGAASMNADDTLRGVVAVPADWPVPEGITYAVDRSSGRAVLWARDSTGSTSCLVVASLAGPGAEELGPCAPEGAKGPTLPFVAPERPAPGVPPVVKAQAATEWTQYRGDGARSAKGAADPVSATGWRTLTSGPVRASVSIASDVVLVGGHDVSVLTALDAVTGAPRWRVNVPNWIHQDPVSDGTYVVVGFGDNDDSFQGHAPSGVAAYELASGRLAWMHFEQSSIMTSAIIADSVTLYVSATGLVRKRRLADGALLGTLQLPGGAIMAPMALTGDTLVATLDRNHVCALTVSSFTTAWCRRLAHLRKLGHAAPTVTDGQVILSGLTTMFALPVGRGFRGHGSAARRYLRTMFESAGGDETIAGQLVVSLDLATGRTRWVSTPFAARAEVTGHNSGTATVESGVGIIVLPNADTVVAFEPRSGEVRWTAGANGGRGPALMVEGRVVVGGRNGRIEVRDALTGAVRCAIARPVGFDRAGPAYTRGLVIFADLDGAVEAVPRSLLLDCPTPPRRVPAGTPADSAPATSD